ncbi:MAG: oligosaccharide flippase family protein [Kiritimatiellales bacterium]|nr:oligosaccharide flippase family protein [Kiritimatiellales bacterium]
MNNPTTHPESAEERGTFFSREAVSGMPLMIISKLVLFFVYFAVSVVTVDALGKENYGVFSLFKNIAGYIMVFCGMGLTAALMRFIPELVVKKNRAGLVQLLWKSALLQLVAVCGVTALMMFLSAPMQRLFKAGHVEHFRLYLLLSCLMVGIYLMKEYVSVVFTSVFKIGTVTALSIIHGVFWLSVLAVWLRLRPFVSTAIAVDMVAYGLVYLVGVFLLIKYLRSLHWRSPPFGIGKRRTLKFSTSVLLTSIVRMMMYKYTEVFFLAVVSGTTVVGIYDLGYGLPSLIITFIPSAILPLFTAGFAEAYVKDEHCLERLISSFYKMLMIVALPVSALGAFFAPAAYHLIYKGEMDEAGLIASAFCLILTLPLISMPLSMAIKAKEKVLNTLPMLLLQITVNLILDWVLIVELKLGVWGGILAVLGTFVLTIPYRLRVVRGIVGGIYFPTAFFARIAAVLFALAAAFFWISSYFRLLERFESHWLNLAVLFVIGGLYMGAFLGLIRLLRLIRRHDLEDFHSLEIERLNKVLRLLTG